ncbi:unnamed protein product, partial [Timema podura]|nr:unnamed protein product [Timema podura]
MSSTTPELHQTWDGSSCCYLSPSMSESMLYLWNWGDEHLKGDESPSSISTACSEAGIRQRTSQLESKRGRPRAEIISHLIVEGSTSPSAIKCTYCNRVFPREKSLQAHLRTHTGTAIFNEGKLGDKKGVAPPAKQVLIHKKLSSLIPKRGNIAKEKGCDKNVCRNVNIPYVHPQVKQSKASEIESASSSLHHTSSSSSGKSDGSYRTILKKHAYISLMIDGSTDRSAFEHATVYVQYVDANENRIKEAILGVIEPPNSISAGERPYPCDYPGCNRAFTQSGQRKTHQRLHTGEKPFVCSHIGCEMRFTHANRHCPQHPFGGIHRSDDFVLRPVESNPEQSSEVLRWLERLYE